MKASDVMTREVKIIGPDKSAQAAAKLMIDNRISGLPVVSDNGEVIGMLSESDLMHRVELGTDDKSGSWSLLFSDPSSIAEKFKKSHGRKVHDIMARPVISVDAEADLGEVADMLDFRKINRVPVMRGEQLVGIITRSDLVRAFSRADTSAVLARANVEAIHQLIDQRLKALSWLDATYLNLTILDGVVHLSGYVQSKQHLDALKILIGETPGVVATESSVAIGTPVLGLDDVTR